MRRRKRLDIAFDDNVHEYRPSRVGELADALEVGDLLYAPPPQNESLSVRDFVHAKRLLDDPKFLQLLDGCLARGVRLEPHGAFYWRAVIADDGARR